MKVKKLREFLNKLNESNPESETWDILVNIGKDYAMIKPDMVYDGSLWNIVIDCDYQPEEIIEEILIHPENEN